MAEQPFFLRLPYDIRRRIYKWLGVICKPDPLTLKEAFDGEWSAREQRFIRENDEWFYIPNQLFYVSRAVSEDVRAALYSEHSLQFDDGWRDNIQTLLNLTPLAWKSLRSIFVLIGTKGCTAWWGPNIDMQNPDRDCHGTVQEISENDAQLEATGILPTWRLICSKLARYNTQDDRFELRLICGAATTETAAAFLAPIHDLPRLKALSIRMGADRRLEIQQMVMSMIRQKTTYFAPEPKGTFPFLELPVELQLRILEYTILIAPRHLMSRYYCYRFIPVDCRLFRCAGYPVGEHRCEDIYCPATHTGFSTAYPCQNTIHDALFLVSKAVRQLALSIYYSRNTFEVWYQERVLPPPVRTPWSPQTSRFLCQLPVHSWQHLRHVRWVFHRLHMPGDDGYNEYVDDWLHTLATLFSSGAIRPCSFTIELHFHKPYWSHPDQYQAEPGWELCDRVVAPVIPWRGLLKDFFVHNYGNDTDYFDKKRRYPREALLEQKVMGKEYDSLARGKGDTFYRYL
ncbi:hypothetical protein BDW59DRAFT_147373 [Aspergillus cavernicola]|uniref:F-box domain-containing protein n=1 Tax=Aspergillus cavernicola TaxID=176166 RepID=A0ABR4I9V5_9EURO